MLQDFQIITSLIWKPGLDPFSYNFPTMQDGLNGLSALSTSTRVANLRVSRSNLDPLKTHGESKGTVPPRNKGPNKAPY